MKIKIWQNWQGKNNFYCQGRLMLSKSKFDLTNSFGIFLSILSTNIFFSVMVGSYYWNNSHYEVSIISWILSLLPIYHLLSVVLFDAGVIPRGNLDNPLKVANDLMIETNVNEREKVDFNVGSNEKLV